DDRNREVFGRERFGFVSDFEDRNSSFSDRLDNRPCENEWENSGRESANGYRCGENGFYFFGDGLCYDDEGFSYHFGEDGFFYDTETGYRFDAGGFSCDSEGRRLPGASMGLSDDENLRNAPPSSSNIRPTRTERVFVDPVSQTPIAESLEADQIEESRPWLPSSSNSRSENRGKRLVADTGASASPTLVDLTSKVADQSPPLPVGSLSLPGSSGAQPLSVSREISDEISLLMTKGISTESSKSISKEFALEYVDAEFSLRPPKLDGWISRRALLLPDKGTLKAINASEDSFAKTQLRIMDIAPPLVDLYAQLSSLPDSDEQWGRAYFYITKERRSAVMSLTEPGAEYLLRDPDAFEGGKEARSFLFTEKYLQAMLTDASLDNTLAQAARAAAAATAARAPRRSSARRIRTDQPHVVLQPPRFETDRNSRGGRGARSRRNDRGRDHRPSAWSQGGRRYVFLNSRPLTPYCKTALRPYPKSGRQRETFPVPVVIKGGEAPIVASRLKVFAARWPLITSDHWVLKTVREGLLIDFLSEPTQNSFPPQIVMSKEMSDVCDAEVRDLLAKRAISEVSDGSIGFVCSFFCVKKKQEGQFRPIINLTFEPLHQIPTLQNGEPRF
ncbi:Uncharacterized protein APZ42_004326, partial [Daphnia magna]